MHLNLNSLRCCYCMQNYSDALVHVQFSLKTLSAKDRNNKTNIFDILWIWRKKPTAHGNSKFETPPSLPLKRILLRIWIDSVFINFFGLLVLVLFFFRFIIVLSEWRVPPSLLGGRSSPISPFAKSVHTGFKWFTNGTWIVTLALVHSRSAHSCSFAITDGGSESVYCRRD